MIARTGAFALLFCVCIVFGASAQKVGVLTSGDQVKFTIGDKPFLTYNLNPKGTRPKPYIWPACAPDGTILTRKILKDSKEGDHPHQKGIWLAVDEVNGVDFWAEKGKIVSSPSVSLPNSRDDQITAVIHNEWKAPDGTTVVNEETRLTVYSNHVLSYDITFTAAKKPVEFDDTKEGLFGIRLVDSMREKVGGTVTNSRGDKGTKNCWGKPAEWVDYSGVVNGKTYGVAIFDHPENFRKSRYHVRDYGLFSINPFGEKAYAKNTVPPTKLAPGKSLRLRYAMYIHDGDATSAKVADVYKRWVAATKAR